MSSCKKPRNELVNVASNHCAVWHLVPQQKRARIFTTLIASIIFNSKTRAHRANGQCKGEPRFFLIIEGREPTALKRRNGPRRLVLRPLRERVYVGGGESEAPIHDIELMPDHYAKDLAFEFLEKFARFECHEGSAFL
jgi:hypothetical protein